ncbi:chitinase domain-containing protein 1-like [Planoprotostelium fungivorum]|uniref:Chitinase domain-containing protein 1 n=1 Tax=Planoprotostelium fungivorum TaxID=1890364 RepID=A0A2P6NBA6_9EUKA|nr:chitinase domain-containing protein 1-like [Planoprotostelium fungivorum]
MLLRAASTLLLLTSVALVAAKRATPESVYDRGLVNTDVNYLSILNEQTNYQDRNKDDSNELEPTKRKNYHGITLAYVTPWNNHGYDIAKIFSCKFDYVSPIWYNIKFKGSSFILEGDHNVDSEWMTEVKDGGCQEGFKTNMVPRFLFDGWDSKAYMQLIQVPTQQTKLIEKIIATCQKFKFDGIVLEGGALLPREYISALLPFYKKLGKSLHGASLKYVLVVGPKREEKASFSHGELDQLGDDVDYLSLMTYDYSPQSPGPNSPTSWMSSSALSLIPPQDEKKTSEKILLGLPFYGYDYTVSSQSAKSLLGKDFIQLIRKYKPDMIWDERDKEHKMEYITKDTASLHVVYYPSLKFIEERLKLAESLKTGISIWEIGQGLDYFYDLL